MSNEVAKKDTSELVAAFSGFNSFLATHGLPTDNVIANPTERGHIANNLPAFLDELSPEIKKDARYLSKFVAGTAIGLFDAALNYVWNEVVLNLRKKTIIYGLDLFYDAAVGGKLREFFKNEEDLQGIKDSVLLDTCRKLELISDVVHKKLTHILTMRNDVAASHPNVEYIGAFELLGWLQTCVKDVLQDRPSESAIKIKALIDNLKSATTVIDDSVVKSMQGAIKDLALPHVNNMLISTFGMFIDPKTENLLRQNISKLAPVIWSAASENVKYNIGIKLDGYKNNLEEIKHKLGLQYLEVVDGLRYQSLPSKIVQLDNLFDQLLDARYGWDNFHHEAPIAREIYKYIKKAEDFPKERIGKFTKTLLICRIGKGISYCQGVSSYAKPYYDCLIGLFDDNAISWSLAHLFSAEINGLLMNGTCRIHLDAILEVFQKNAIGERLKEAIIYLKENLSTAYKANKDPKFIELTKMHINWNI